MRNTKGDVIWVGIIVLFALLLILPSSRERFIETTEKFPYISGFIKFFILASMGDLLGARILRKEWVFPKRFILKGCVWGVLGMAITLVFTVYMAGAEAAQLSGKLPFAGAVLAQAFFGSLIMNTTFGPMMYVYHRLGDFLVDEGIKGFRLDAFSKSVDWDAMVSFFWAKTCLLVWVPCHTIVFLLPPEYRVLASAFLSILLGIIVALSKKKSIALEAAS